MSEQETKEEIAKSDKKKITFLKSLSFALQFGFMIVLPLVFFAFLGKWLSAKYENPVFLYAGLILALTTSAIWFYIRINSLYKDFID